MGGEQVREYADAIAVSAIGDGEYAAHIPEGWQIGGATFGGYLLSLAGSAIRAELAASGQPDPFALTTYFLSVTTPGPATIRVRRLRSGRTATVSAVMTQEVDGVAVERFSTLATFGDLSKVSGDGILVDKPPALPPIEECLPTWAAPQQTRDFVQIMDRFDYRLDPACSSFALTGRPGGTNFVQGYFQHKPIDGVRAPIDPIALLAVTDVLPPVSMDLAGEMGWVPTLELSAFVRALPAPGPLRVRHETRTYGGGFFEEDCVIFDSDDKLVAQSRQVALQPRPVK